MNLTLIIVDFSGRFFNAGISLVKTIFFFFASSDLSCIAEFI
jgi:hypothetical protein